MQPITGQQVLLSHDQESHDPGAESDSAPAESDSARAASDSAPVNNTYLYSLQLFSCNSIAI